MRRHTKRHKHSLQTIIHNNDTYFPLIIVWYLLELSETAKQRRYAQASVWVRKKNNSLKCSFRIAGKCSGITTNEIKYLCQQTDAQINYSICKSNALVAVEPTVEFSSYYFGV